MKGLSVLLQEDPGFNALIEKIEKQHRKIMIYGLSESQRAYVTSAIWDSSQKSQLIITPDSLTARRLWEDLKFFLPGENVYIFPVGEILPYEVAAHSTEITAQRLMVMEKLLSGERAVVIAPVNALFQKLVPSRVFEELSFTVAVGDTLNVRDFSEKLVIMGYERVDMIEGHGHFSIRGGIIDVFPLTADSPYRIELFDDEVDSIRLFDIFSQRSIVKVEKVNIFPAREMILTRQMAEQGRNKIARELDERIKLFQRINKPESGDNLKERISHHLALMEENLYFEGLEMYISYFYDRTNTIMDYFKCGVLTSIYDPERVIEASRLFSTEHEEIYKQLLEKGQILASQSNVYHSSEELLMLLSQNSSLYFSHLPVRIDDFPVDEEMTFASRAMHPFYGKIDLLVDDIKTWRKKGFRIILLAGTEDRGRRFRNNLQDNDIDPLFLKSIPDVIPPGTVVVTEGSVEKGFEFPGVGLVVVSDWEIFGKAKKKKSIKRKADDGIRISTFSELSVGDYVVHVNHGIGRYTGIKTIEIQGNRRDYIGVKYHGGDMLYIPTDQVHLIQKYIGSDDSPPKLNKLGGLEWARVKNRVKESIRDMADDLIKLYAAREAVKGYAFSPDTPWQKEFEDLFPYEETPDQLQAVEEVKRDMERPRPMDRLLCGDVGYGKTEVALRAAFKAVMDGKQVGVLVPTTILAQQHYQTFTERFAGFPVTLGLLSRFKTHREQREVIAGLKTGTVDIVIGTHRLLQKDVKFKNLGLLIVDEEQRFGVAHKERLKQMRKNVDVLTLTATPIPRTLHMALSGIRDMSLIETPPEDRYPVQTYVLEYNDLLVREAILRELARKGQVYYVYNRIDTIDKEAARIASLVPEARIAVAHGQMKESELEQVMLDFYEGKYDILVCTTIIESGLDIPNVNTLIVTHGDKLGLSQLYQLRGRVGRSNRVAYAYITYHKGRRLTEIAQKRLQAIRDFTEFGAGFKIAMRDLEIRGAGNLLGPQQHGHMMAVGYELYCKLLNETIKELRGEVVSEEIEPAVDFQVSAYIDDGYIQLQDQKIEFYKRIAGAGSIEEIYGIEEEMEDRFGDIPENVRNLLEIAVIKIMARELGIISIVQNGDSVTFTTGEFLKNQEDDIKKLVNRYPRRFDLSRGKAMSFTYRAKDAKGYHLLKKVRKILEELKTFNSEGIVV